MFLHETVDNLAIYQISSIVPRDPSFIGFNARPICQTDSISLDISNKTVLIFFILIITAWKKSSNKLAKLYQRLKFDADSICLPWNWKFEWEWQSNENAIQMGMLFKWESHSNKNDIQIEMTFKWESQSNENAIQMRITFIWECYSNENHIQMRITFK